MVMDDVLGELVAMPAAGRVFHSCRQVRLGDVTVGGALRLDSCARYLQDVANDDSLDSGHANPLSWVARRTVIHVVDAPQYLDRLRVSTWCGGLGSRWAQRRYSIRSELSDSAGAGRVEAATTWVHIDADSHRPLPLPVGFVEQFAQAAGGRTVSAKLTLPTSPADGEDAAQRWQWPLRAVDFDIMDHVNNAVYLAIAEEHLAERLERGSLVAILEHHRPIERGAVVEVSVTADGSTTDFLVHSSTTAGATSLAATIRLRTIER